MGDPSATGDLASVDGQPTFSRAQIHHLMRVEFARGRRHGYPVTCMILEIDSLGDLVRAHGDGVRQAALRTVHQVVLECIRTTDHLGLMDGERLLLVLTHTTVWDGERVAERIRTNFETVEVRVDGRRLGMTLSIGLSGASPPEPPLFETVMTKAEGAVERAARIGNSILAIP